ncbi:MAG: hypothetical protein CR986_10095 [Ignavibacteriae bacterium]|nr:MAG: hypothetical protein CR986_10095 [Ignavibacteriota bacterium]
MYKKILYILFIAFTISVNGQQDLKYNLSNVVVTANRVPVPFSEIGRSLDVITQKEIELLPVTSIQDLLEFTSGIDIKQRGPEDVQSDVTMRGGSFEQTLIMIDGIKLIDPQTGHHNMNLPISFSQIEKIEILKGHGSSIYGANAFGGVINIIPKRNDFSALDIDLAGGENNYDRVSVSGSLKLSNTNHNLNFTRTQSDGYRHNTEFENYNLSLNNSFNFSNAVIKTIFGYTDKNFGANSYYTTRFPNQAEKTKTLFAAISSAISLNKFIITPKIYWRNNEDEFVLNKYNHGFYKNNHETNVYGAELQATTNILGGTTTIGGEFIQQEIESSNLGEHNRQTKGFFVEQKINLTKKLNINLGGFAYYYSKIDWKFWPGIDLAYNLTDQIKLFANYGKAFRMPTYTELFYNDPITRGNANLVHEEMNNYEFGFTYRTNILEINTSLFRKEGTNLIDYVKNNESGFWHAENFSEINTNGIEFGIGLRLSKFTNNIIKSAKIDYTYLDSDKSDLSAESRYVLEHLKHDISLMLVNSLLFDIVQSWTFSYEDRLTLGDHFTVDTKLSRNFNNFNIYVKATNLLNKSYEEIPGVPLPGRWLIAGIKFSIL